MSLEPPSNIFDAAAGKKPAKELPEKKATREEVEQMIHQLYKQHDEVEKKLDTLYVQSGLNPHEITAFLNNPQNLTDAQLKLVADRKARLERDLFPKGKKGKEKPKESDASLKRKGKTLGGRKGWISM